MDIRKAEVTLDPSEVPYDVTFVIEECGSEVKAHKLIMAMGSPMCLKQFYGELKEIEGKIVIKSTTKDAFTTMVDFFYGKEVNWEKKTAEELFEIANMAEKYQVVALKEKIDWAARNCLHISEETVVTIAAVAKNYSQFEDLNNTILFKCTEFLSSILQVRDDCCEFAIKYSGTELSNVAFTLLAGMKNVKPPVKRCCELKTCRRGKPMLEITDFQVGDTVRFNPDGILGDHQVDEEIVKDIADTYDGVIYLDEDHWETYGYPIKYHDAATFLFCKC